MARVRKTRETNKKEETKTVSEPLIETQKPIQQVENTETPKKLDKENIKDKIKAQSLADFLY